MTTTIFYLHWIASRWQDLWELSIELKEYLSPINYLVAGLIVGKGETIASSSRVT
jgi:hypothetical protein